MAASDDHNVERRMFLSFSSHVEILSLLLMALVSQRRQDQLPLFDYVVLHLQPLPNFSAAPSRATAITLLGSSHQNISCHRK